MKRIRRKSLPPELLWAIGFGRLFLNFQNLASFYGTTLKSLEIAKSQLEEEWHDEAEESLNGPEFEEMLKKSLFGGNKGFLKGIVKATADRARRVSQQTVNSAALVFAHTVLDETLSECCHISFIAKPADWHRFVVKRQVEVGWLNERTTEELIHKLASEFVQQQERESMVKRLQLLNQVCAPKFGTTTIPTAWITQEMLQDFDEVRQRIIHGDKFAKEISAINDKLNFAKQAGLSALFLVAKAHDLLDKRPSIDNPRTVLRFLVTFKQEFPEFFELIRDTTLEKNPAR
jgi:hypothetical protein